jgi:hypothetical protein
LKAEIEKALAPLLSLDLLTIGRAANLEWFTFGHHDGSGAGNVELAPFALHAACPWRLLLGEKILAGSGDHRRPASEDTPEDDFDAGLIGSELIDLRHVDVRKRLEEQSHSVVRVHAEDSGGLQLSLSHGLTLELFPDASMDEYEEVEFWRFFQPGLDYSHFVVGSTGIDRVSDA